MSTVFSQNVDDALRYSQIFYGGTARSMAMGGAFTALGGDISSLSQNPAGLGVFRTSEITLTPQLFRINTSASYNGKTSDNLSDFNLNQIGIVSNILSRGAERGLLSLNIGYSFNRMSNFSQTVRIQGTSSSSSMADYWAALGNSNGGTYFKDLGGAEGIAFDAWVMDTVRGSGGRNFGTAFSNYGDNPPSVYGQNVRRLITNEGYIGEHDFSIGGNYSNKFYFGATFALTKLRYVSHYEHLESVNTALPSQLKDFTYTDHYEDKGTGYSLKLGAIYRPVEAVRIGLAFHTPTWFKIDEYYYNDITSHFTDGAHYEASNDPMRFNYGTTTPYRILAGIGVQIKKIALLSADYEYADYSAAKFRETGDGYNYSVKNSEIRNSLKAASNIRLGAELRLNTLYLRAGYGYYGKAFKAGEDNADLNYNTVSVGAGFREQNFSVDFAYTYYNYSQNYFLYPVESNVNQALAGLSTTRNLFTLTLGYRFGM